MKILVAGAGPAGLYFAYLAKRQHPDWQIRVVEQNPADSTFGFGVVFSDRALEFLRDDDAETYERITPQMEIWTDLEVVHRGTTRRFETLTQTFVENQHGTFNAHHYRHAPAMSTFVVECDAKTWERAGFASMNEADTLTYCEEVFAGTLGGHRLVSNKSVWRNFPNLRNARWSSGNVVLIGDALRTAHFSIGSGTRLAMEDAIALAKALRTEANIDKALRNFEAARRPIVEKLVAAADASAEWYERFAEHMRLAPRDFAWSYIQRSGRIDRERLRQVAPKFAGEN